MRSCSSVVADRLRRARFFGAGAAGLLLTCSLSASPDPDLFDGRVRESAEQSDVLGGASGAPAEAAPEAVAGAGDAAPEGVFPSEKDGRSAAASERDFSQIGGIGSGGEGSSGNPSAPASSGKNAGESAGGTAGVPPTATASGEAGAPAAESAPGAASGTSGDGARNFSELGGVGASGSGQTVEVNSSKADPAQADPSRSGPSGGQRADPNAPTKRPPEGSGTGGFGSESHDRSGSGDYGDTIPSGL